MKKKLFLVMIAVVMFVGALNVYALTTSDEVSPSDPNSKMITDTATLTVQNVTIYDNFYAYKILDAYYNVSTNVVSYEFTDDFNTFLEQSSIYQDFTVEDYYQLTSGDITSGSTITTSTADKLMSAYVTYIRGHSEITGTEMDVTGTTATATLQAGAYLVLPLIDTVFKQPSGIYAVMLGNLDVTASNSNWVVNDETIVAKRSDIGFTFNVGDESDVFAEDDVFGPLLSFSIGEKFPFEAIGQAPQFPTNATNKIYTFEIGFDEIITLECEIGSIVVKDGETTLTTSPEGIVTNASGNTVATITIDEESYPGFKILRITFNTDYLTSSEVSVEGEASLTDQALIGEANEFSGLLKYSNDSYGTETITVGASSELYTFGLNILKYDAADGTPTKLPLETPLANAVFDIYSDQELKNKVGTVTTGEDGIAAFNGLKYGTYYVKETKAPTGYQLVEDPIEVKVGDNDGVDTYAAPVPAPSYPLALVYVPNAKMGLLPVTGGVGLVIYAIIGVVIVGSGVGLLVYYKKKKNKVKDNNIDII